jgi:DNA repair exonuclease SbcCD ATPase subunit
MDYAELTPETTISPPPEHLSDIIGELELKIKEYEKNTVPKYLNEVQELEDKLLVMSKEKAGIKSQLDACRAAMADQEKAVQNESRRRITELEGQVSRLEGEKAKIDTLLKDNKLLAREIERYEDCIREATLVLEENNLVNYNLEHENQELKLLLREKQKENSNLREQLLGFVESQGRMKDLIGKIDQLSTRISKELDVVCNSTSSKDELIEINLETSRNEDQSILIIETLLDNFTRLRDSIKRKSQIDDSCTLRFYQSGNFEEKNPQGLMKKVPSVPILNSKMIAQLKEAKERELNSLHSSMRIPEARTMDSDPTQKDLFQQLLASNFENRRLSNALTITSKQYNAAVLEKNELVDELNQLKSSLAKALETNRHLEATYVDQIRGLHSQLVRSRFEMSAIIASLQQEIASKTTAFEVARETDERRAGLEAQVARLREESRQEREKSRGLLAMRDTLVKQLQRAEVVNEDLKMMIGHKEERIRDLTSQRGAPALQSQEIYKNKLSVSLKNFKSDIDESLKIRERLKKEHETLAKSGKTRVLSPVPNLKTMSNLEMVKELKVRIDVIQKINSN